MTQTAHKIPEVLTLKVTPTAFRLIRACLGSRPHDEVSGLCVELESQVGAQVEEFNQPVPAPAESSAAAPGAESPAPAA
jgi:hypothetical protein